MACSISGTNRPVDLDLFITGKSGAGEYITARTIADVLRPGQDNTENDVRGLVTRRLTIHFRSELGQIDVSINSSEKRTRSNCGPWPYTPDAGVLLMTKEVQKSEPSYAYAHVE